MFLSERVRVLKHCCWCFSHIAYKLHQSAYFSQIGIIIPQREQRLLFAKSFLLCLRLETDFTNGRG